MTHILGFTTLLFRSYPAGNVLFQDDSGLYYLNSTAIQR